MCEAIYHSSNTLFNCWIRKCENDPILYRKRAKYENSNAEFHFKELKGVGQRKPLIAFDCKVALLCPAKNLVRNSKPISWNRTEGGCGLCATGFVCEN